MKQVDEAPPAADVAVQPNTGMPEHPFPERSPDQDDFNRSFRAGTKAMGDLLRRRRKMK